MARDNQPTGRDLIVQSISAIENRRDEFAKLLPAHIPSDKFVRVIKTAIGANPDLAKVDPGLLVVECMKCAADGLVADGRQAAIVIYNQKVKGKRGEQDRWEKRPKYMPMKDGLIQRARNSGELLSIAGYIVYEEEIRNPRPAPGKPGFRRWIDDIGGEHILHEPMVRPKGPVAGAYSMARLKNGVIDFCFMDIDDILAIKNRSKSKNDRGGWSGPWASDEKQMMIKTVFRRHSKTLPMDSDLARVFQRDDDMTDLSAPAGAPPITKQRGAAASLLNDPEPEEPEIEDGDYEDIVDDPEPEPEPRERKRDPEPRGRARNRDAAKSKEREERNPSDTNRPSGRDRSDEDDPF